MFLENSSKRPVIVLSGIKVADLRAIMQFIYTGEVNVTEDSLQDLLEVADLLGVRGLKTGADKDDHKETEEEFDTTNEDSRLSSVKDYQEVENNKLDNEDVAPSIEITKISAPTSDEKKELNSSSNDGFQISVKKDLTNQLDIGDSENIVDDNIAADEDHELVSDIKTEASTFATPFPQSLMAQASLLSSSASSLSMSSSPLVNMSNLAAMYQQQHHHQQHQQQHVSPTKPMKEKSLSESHHQKPLEWYRANSQEGKVSLDLLPEDINSIMSQSTTPFCPICSKDCANFPNLRSHLQV